MALNMKDDGSKFLRALMRGAGAARLRTAGGVGEMVIIYQSGGDGQLIMAA